MENCFGSLSIQTQTEAEGIETDRRSCSHATEPGIDTTDLDRHVEALLKDEAVPFHLRAVIAILLEDRRRNLSILNVCNDLTEQVKALRAENLMLRSSLELSEISCDSISPATQSPSPVSQNLDVSSTVLNSSQSVDNASYSHDVIISGVIESNASKIALFMMYIACVRY